MESTAISGRLFFFHTTTHFLPSHSQNSLRITTAATSSRVLHRLRCIHVPSPNPPTPATTQLPPQPHSLARSQLSLLVDEFRGLTEPVERVKRLLSYASQLPPMSEKNKITANRVMGCTALVWAAVAIESKTGRLKFEADSDSEITRGFCACLVGVLNGSSASEVLELRPDDFSDLNVVGLPGRTSSRANTWHNVLISLQKKTSMLIAEEEGRQLAAL